MLTEKTEYTDWMNDVVKDITLNDKSLFPKSVIEILNEYLLICEKIGHTLIVLQIMSYFSLYQPRLMDSHLNFVKTYLDIDQVYSIENNILKQHEAKK